eukprot:scaffold65139_cov14-Tisochrysis_lutea.AAC.1
MHTCRQAACIKERIGISTSRFPTIPPAALQGSNQKLKPIRQAPNSYSNMAPTSLPSFGYEPLFWKNALRVQVCMSDDSMQVQLPVGSSRSSNKLP